jgi:hypothetical protein
LSASVNRTKFLFWGDRFKRDTKDESTKFKELPVSTNAGKVLEKALILSVIALRSVCSLGASDRP